ncbi:MAG: polysaccharide biosynthesis/export family protein [Acidobacteriota bacterium]
MKHPLRDLSQPSQTAENAPAASRSIPRGIRDLRVHGWHILSWCSAFVCLLLLVPLAAFAQAPTDAATTPRSGSTYLIGPKDLLEIKVYEVPDLDGPRRVTADGTISFPPLEDLVVEGLTVEDLEQELKRQLEADYFQKATVSVQVAEYRSRPISVIGAVNNPGDLGFSGRWTLLEAITAAGGLAGNHGSVIYVLRRAETGLSDQVAIPINDLMVRADPKVNIPIFANDLINIPATAEITVYCLGEVSQPGAIVFRSTERITLLAAIARAGGVSDRASSKILVKRTDNTTGVEQEIELDYRRILSGKDSDFRLAEGDVVVVKESFF